MPKSTSRAAVAAVPGRLQPGRQPAPLSARAQVRAERRLQNAMSVPIEQLIPDPEQPRTNLTDPDQRVALAELAESIREHGVLQPLLVREHGLLEDHRTLFMIVAGERRYLAAQEAGKQELPCVLYEGDPRDVKLIQLQENTQRENLSALNEAQGYWLLMQTEDLSGHELARRVKKSHSYVAQRLGLLRYPEVQEALRAGTVKATVGQEIAQIKDETARRKLLERAGRERLRVKDVKEIQGALREPSPPRCSRGADGVSEARPAADAAPPPAAPTAAPSASGASAHAEPDATAPPDAPGPADHEGTRPGADPEIGPCLVDLATLNTVRLTSRGRGTAPWEVVWAALEADRAALSAKRPRAGRDGDS